MDEVGRGTSVQDGLAIAFSTIHHLITVNKSRTLFATHFHELADLLGCSDGERGDGVFQGVKFFYTDVDETGVSCEVLNFARCTQHLVRMDTLRTLIISNLVSTETATD